MNNTERFINDNLDIVGVFNGSIAFAAPEYVVLDITNSCNCDCIACWTYSPLLGDKKASKEWQSQRLSCDIVGKIVNELSGLGTKEIRLTGGGEPFLHKDVMKIIRCIKEKGMRCSVTTNLTPINQKRLHELVSLGLDILTVSLWAGDRETYATTHPNQTGEIFYKMTEVLRVLKSLPGKKPKLVISNVITNLNYHKIDQILDFALEMGAAEVYFAVVDPIIGKTDSLLLNNNQRKVVLERLKFFKEKFSGSEESRLDGVEQFTRRLSNPDSEKGVYDGQIVNTIPCYTGWMFARIMADGNFSPCCRGVNIPTGNIYEDDFSSIWNGQKQQQFRRVSLKGDKMSPYFLKVGCHKSCDNLPQNLWMHHRIESLSPEQRNILLEKTYSLNHLKNDKEANCTI